MTHSNTYLKLPLQMILLILMGLFLFTPALALDDLSPQPFAPVQEGFNPNAQVVLPYHPERILVKFKASALMAGNLDITMDKGAAIDSDLTGIPSIDALCGKAGVKRISRPWIAVKKVSLSNALGLDRWYMLETNGASDPLAMAREFLRDPNVEAAEPDWRAFPAAVPNDALYSSQWGHNNTGQLLSYDWATNSHENGSPVGTVGFDTNAQAAWDAAQGYGSSSVIIAIIDSGVDVGHPDLRQVTGYDYGDNDSNPDDDSASSGHGTACAGVAAAMVNNGIGAAGAAGGVSIMPLKVADSAGSMYFSAIQNALYYAADNGADIVSMSLGAAISSDSATDTAIQYAFNAGCTILAATGNENASTISYPAIHANVIGVGAASPCGDRKRSSSNSSEVNSGVSTDPNGYTCDGERWWGSNYGSTTQDNAGAVDIIAPTILPTTDIQGSGGYDSSDYSMWFNGTSCATPYAAGVCALIVSANPGWTPAQVRDQLVNTAQDITNVESGTGWDRYSGYGMIDAAAAVAGGSTPVDAVTVSSPNGGETLTAGANWTIGWTYSGTFTTVALDYSTDGGNNWTAITASTTNDGSYSWSVPSSATTSGRVRVSGGTAQDSSDGNFTIDVPVSNTYASLPYSTGFETGAVDQYWYTESTEDGRVLVATANTPHTGNYHLTMDDPTSGGYSLNGAWLNLDLAGEANVDFSFWWKEFGDETNTEDGIYFSDNGGSSFVKVQDLNGSSYTNQTWTEFNLDLDQLAAGNGLTLSSTFVIKFQQYDNYPITTDGFAFDDISITSGAVVVDDVTLTYPNGGETLTGGAAVDITWTWVGDFGTVDLDYSSDGGSNWTSIVSGTNNDGAFTWTVPSTATTTGRVRVTGGTANDSSNTNFAIEVTVPTGDYATVPYTTGFESGSLDQFWTTASTVDGQVQVMSANTPHSGTYHMTMDDPTRGGYAQNEAWLHLDLSGETEVDLAFWWQEFGDETHAQDGIFFSDDDGATFSKVQDLNGSSYTNQTWTQFNLDLDQLAGGAGLSLTSTFVVKFQQYDNYPMTTDGFAFDDISVATGSTGGGGGTAITAETEPNADSTQANGPVGDGVAVTGSISSSSDDDFFWFDVASAGNINISVAIGSSADLDWYLYDNNMNQVDRGYTVSNPEAGSYTAAVGHYYLKVDGYNGATSGYTLTVTGGVAVLDEAPEKADLPQIFALDQNMPNPFNPMTTIRFSLPTSSLVKLDIFDQRGRLVRRLVSETLAAGQREVIWNGRDDRGRQVQSGVYLYRIEAGNFRAIRKMTLLK